MSTIQTGTMGHVYCTLPTSANPEIERSIPRFSGLSDEATVEDTGLIPVKNALSSIKFYFSPLSHLILAHLNMLRVSFWNTLMFVVRVDVRDVRPSTFCLCTLQRAQF